MKINYKKIILLVGFVALVAALGILLYLVFFRTASEPTTPDMTGTTATGGGLPGAAVGTPDGNVTGADGQLPAAGGANPAASGESATATDNALDGGLTPTIMVANEPSRWSTLSANGDDVVYYNQQNGKFYRAGENTAPVELSDKVFFNAQSVTWAPSKDKAIIEYPDGANILYNFQTGQQFSLPQHWQDFNFSPDSGRIVAKSIGSDPDNRWLIVANDDGLQALTLEPIGEKDASVYVSWSPNNLSVAMYSESIDFDRQRLYFVGLNHENFKSTVIEGRGFEHQWDPAGGNLLYSVYSSTSQLKPTLWAVSAKGEDIGSDRRTLGLQTWAHKCAFADAQTLYCAVPDSLPEGAGLFPELAQNSVDSLYKVDLKSGSQTLVAVPNGRYNMDNIIIAKDGGTLYFTDYFLGSVHAINLK